MRLQTARGETIFLGYCANVHPGESLARVLEVVRVLAPAVRARLALPELSVGLWLGRDALSELERVGTAELHDALSEAGILVCTFNGFPYGNFHADVVKRRVYKPDLTTPERREYLLGLARVLCELLPPDASEGTISTLPIGHKAEVAEDSAERAASELCRLVGDLARLRDRSGRSIRICLEPEPGCVLETTREAIEFFTGTLPRAARQCGVESALLAQHLGICYDTCHQAVAFEDARTSIRSLSDAGIVIGKAQLSSALELARPAQSAEELLRFDEPRFLHQARALRADGTLAEADDLSEIGALPRDRAWRVHFHVPIHRAAVGELGTTRDFLCQALPELALLPHVPHLEVETYTWSVLPEAERPKTDADLVRGLADEIAWARGALP